MSPQPPAYSAEPAPNNAKEVLDHAHPRIGTAVADGQHEYEAMADALGVRCTVLEEEVELRRMEAEKRGAGEIGLQPHHRN